MTNVRVTSAALLASAITLVMLASCGSDSSTGNGPTGAISGTITFRNQWPSTGAIFVTVFTQYPPTGSPDGFTNAITENMLGAGRTYKYKVDGLETGTYKAVLVGWRGGVGNDVCMGLYWAFPDSVGLAPGFCVAQDPGPLPVTVKKNQTTTGINMVADLSKVSSP
jgi:uncharacterized protein (DUF2141 family)